MEDSVQQRLRGFLKEQNMSINQISLNANYPQSTLNKQINKETSMSLSTLLVLLDLFSELSAEWLLRGEGSMLKTVTSNDTSASSDDKVKDVAVIGIPDKRLGEITGAVISIKDGMECTEEEINEYCMKLPRYKRPKKLIFADVPRNAT